MEFVAFALPISLLVISILALVAGGNFALYLYANRNERNKWKRIGSTMSLVILLYLVYAYKPPGYCETQERVIPDEEICANLFDKAINEGHLELGVSENTGRDYFMNHPKYCLVSKTAMGRFRRDGLLFALLSDRIEIYLTYKMSDKGKKYWRHRGGESHTLWKAQMLMTPCGKITEALIEISD